MKEQDNAMPEIEVKIDISNVPDGEFKAMIIRILIVPEKEWKTSVKHLPQR